MTKSIVWLPRKDGKNLLASIGKVVVSLPPKGYEFFDKYGGMYWKSGHKKRVYRVEGSG